MLRPTERYYPSVSPRTLACGIDEASKVQNSDEHEHIRLLYPDYGR